MSQDKDTLDRIQPLPKSLELCRVILRSTEIAPNAIGFANIRIEPARVTIVGFDLPAPTTFGSEFTRYRGWVVDIETFARFRIDMEMVFPGVWAGHESNGSLVNFDEVFVTPEPVPGATAPIGPRVLVGSLVQCINETNQLPRVNIVAIPGDTLFSLARIFSVLTIEEILALNPGIVDPNVIFPGQIIAIPSVAPVPPDAPLSPAQYLVRPGESLFSIAQRFGLTVPLILAVNPQIVDPDIISVNQVINLPVTPPLPPLMDTIQIYVSVGETLLSISRRTGVSLQAIIAANPQIIDPNIIFVGQIINVPLN